EDYFETGIKSNWDQGYSWRLFEELFRSTASFLTGVFTEASSYLDVGCGKGFLVRALRDRDKESFGFDHSGWAIGQADASVRPFLIQNGVDTVHYDRTFDVMTAFSIFESLTEDQVRAFLTRARTWTRQALLAVISSFEGEEEASAARDGD